MLTEHEEFGPAMLMSFSVVTWFRKIAHLVFIIFSVILEVVSFINNN